MKKNKSFDEKKYEIFRLKRENSVLIEQNNELLHQIDKLSLYVKENQLLNSKIDLLNESNMNFELIQSLKKENKAFIKEISKLKFEIFDLEKLKKENDIFFSYISDFAEKLNVKKGSRTKIQLLEAIKDKIRTLI